MTRNIFRRQDDPDGVQRWRERTPEVVQNAIVDVFHGCGSPAQKKLVNEWVEDRVHNASSGSLEPFIMLYHGRRQDDLPEEDDSDEQEPEGI